MSAPDRLAALDAALDVLACPICLGALARDGRALRCTRGHAFDVARQGYAALAVGAAVPGDTAPMVRDRVAFLAAGHYADVAAAVERTVPTQARWVADLASGPGTYLASVLDARPAARGIALDASAPAIRVAAAAHVRAAAATADLRARIPLRDAAIDVALVVFGPRSGPELDRVLVPDGSATVVVPEADHLAELRGPFGTLAVAPDKDERLRERLRPLRLADEERVATARPLPPADVARAVLMGPNGHHLDHDAVRAQAEALGPIEVTIDVRVTRWVR